MDILTNLYSTGADAYKNLFLVKFNFGQSSPLSDNSSDTDSKTAASTLSVRCSAFEPPAVEQGEYEVRFMNQKISKPNAKIKLDRKFTITFRVDENYSVYKALINQMKITFDPENSVTKTHLIDLNSSNYLFDVDVEAIKGDMQDSGNEMSTISLFSYSKCWIDSITPSEYSYSDSQPVTVDVSIRFIEQNTSI